MGTPVQDFVSQQLELLQEEREAELSEARAWQESVSLKELQRRGVCLLKLEIASQRTGLYGRVLVTFQPKKHGSELAELPCNSFGPGDIVGLYEMAGQSDQLATGIVTRMAPKSITIAVDEPQNSPVSLNQENSYRLLKLANDVTYKRLRRALNTLSHYHSGPSSGLIDVLFGTSEPSDSSDTGEVGFLAEDQRINVAITRARRHVAVICDSRTMGNHGFLKRLVDYMNEHGEVRTAFEYLDDIVPENYSHQSSQGLTEQGKRPKGIVPPIPKADGEKPKEKSVKQAGQRPVENSAQSTARVTTQEMRIKENEHKARILDFLKSSATQLDFPPSLNAHDRLLVHQWAEEYGLQHGSTGEGKERYISIFKRVAAARLPQGDGETHEQQLPHSSQSLPKEIHSHEKRSSTSAGKVDLKTLHVERMQREKDKREARAKLNRELNANLQENAGKNLTNEVKGKAAVKTRVENVTEEDFDALISAAMKADNTCAFPKCKASVMTLGQLCLHCNKRYCLSHHIPEVHGCEEKAKAHARQRISKEGVLYAGSGVKDRSVDPAKRAHLQRRLDKKLSELTNQRKGKKKDKEK